MRAPASRSRSGGAALLWLHWLLLRNDDDSLEPERGATPPRDRLAGLRPVSVLLPLVKPCQRGGFIGGHLLECLVFFSSKNTKFPNS